MLSAQSLSVKDHRITKSLRLEGTSWYHLVQPPAQAEQGHLEQVSHNHVQSGFENLQGQTWQTSLGNLCQCLTTLTVKKHFHVFRWNFLVFDLRPLPVRGYCWEKFGFLFSILSSQVFIGIDKIHPSLFFSCLRSPGSLSLSSYERGSSPLIMFVALHWTS